MDESFDVFISYAHEDAAWVHTLADNLHRAGLDVFLDEWEIAPGDVLVHRLEAGLLAARNGVLVVSPASVSRPWVQQEYAVMVERAVAGAQRLIPVLLGDVEIPLFAATRLWVDFRGVDGPEYQRRVGRLAATLQGKRPERPARYQELIGPPGSEMRPEGARRVILRIGPDETVLFAGDGSEVKGRPAGLSNRVEERLWQVERARRQGWQSPGVTLRTPPETGGTGVTLHERLVELGRELADAFLPTAVRAALATEVAQATGANTALRLAVEVTDETLTDLPWEALVLPEIRAGSLVLHPRVELYRAVPGLGVTPAIQIPGPLRILVVIGSPDQGERGELLDYEAELKRILDAVEPARRQHRAHVRILNRGTATEVRSALAAQRYHILHISCHARPGALVLEADNGHPDLITAKRFAEEILVADRGVPLVVLAGCSTALAHRASTVQQPVEASSGPAWSVADQGEAALPGLARQLLELGIPAVLAMNAPVTDLYATRLGAQLYRELATQERPDPLTAASEARRRVDAELRTAPAGLRDAPMAELAEWATPVLSMRGPSLPLFDPAEPFERVQDPAEQRLASGVVVRRIGDFVGRRREERLLSAALDGGRAGVVLHGIGGVGKSTLAAQLVADLGERAGLVISLAGTVSVDQVLDETGRRLFAACLAQGIAEDHLLRRLARLLREPKVPWSDRLDVLAAHLFGQQPVLLLLDNFEDNLHPATRGQTAFEVADGELANFLAALIEARGRSRLLVTSRHPFTLPGGVDKRLETHHLGPLSPAETRKLIWRLSALDRLEPAQLQRAYADVGGHPRALEYLDALLAGGRARFDDVAERLERALHVEHIDNPHRWLTGIKGNLDRALAETITLAVNDVLLTELLNQVDTVPLARQLLLGISVYRRPVDQSGVAWQVAQEVTEPANPIQNERLRWAADVLGLTASELARMVGGSTDKRRPPLMVADGLDNALTSLVERGLIAPSETDEVGTSKPGWVVHRWTAAALARLAATSDLIEAHRRAARYWRWHFTAYFQDPQAAVAALLEARYHHQAAGDLDHAVKATEWACTWLHNWGAWSWEERLCLETRALVPTRSRDAALFTHRLGKIAHSRGDYDQALNHYRKALTISWELGDRDAMARSFHQLGVIIEQRGDYDDAVYHYHKALAISEELGDRASVASSYHQLGNVAFRRSDYEQALDYYRKALAISEELDLHAGIASAYGQLGMVAQVRGDYEQAVDYYRKALAISEGLGDRASQASNYHSLGKVAEERADYGLALDYYRKALGISEELGDRQRVAYTYGQLGMVAQAQGEYELALDYYRQTLATSEELGDRSSISICYHQLGMVAQERGDDEQALNYYRQALAIREELGDRVGMASTINQVGILHTENGNLEDGLSWNLRSLLIRYELRSQQASTNLRFLARQRTLLGSKRFQQLLAKELGDKDSHTVMSWLQQLPDSQ